MERARVRFSASICTAQSLDPNLPSSVRMTPSGLSRGARSSVGINSSGRALISITLFPPPPPSTDGSTTPLAADLLLAMMSMAGERVDAGADCDGR
eukprot:750399-Hanusia_phi.AAC.1